MKKTILIFLLITNCSIFEDPIQAYYNFENNDFNKLLSLELNNVIKYENQFGEEIIYEVSQVSDEFKNQRSKGNWVTSTVNKLFFFDEKNIELKSSSENCCIEYRFFRYPIDNEQAEENEYKKYPSEFYGSVYLYFWNGIGDYGKIDINYQNEKVNMLINGVNYENVIVIKSNSDTPRIISSSTDRNVNIVYYDIIKGIVGFDDLDNKQWRIIN